MVSSSSSAYSLRPTHTHTQGGGVLTPISINGKVLPELNKTSLETIEYDIVIVGGVNISMASVLKDAQQLELDVDKIVLDRTIMVPGFTLEKYKILRHSQLSILSQNCWGGLISHLFGLSFLSPTVNLIVTDFMKFCREPQRYIDKELRFYATEQGNFKGTKWNYPAFMLGDIKLNFLHYSTAEEARMKWESRRLKINWYNVIVVTYAEDRAILEEFDRLPFAKKVCFVPFETKLNAGYQIPQKLVRDRSFGFVCLDVAHNIIHPFDLWDMLLYGKKTPLNV